VSDFVLHPDAYKDLEEIWDYIAEAADRLIEEIFQTIRSFLPYPNLGHKRPDLTRREQRFQTVGPYLIAYAPDEKPLVVTAVLHGRRSPRIIAAILSRRS
jgi:plasmid stabilization system protein ParE